MTDESHYTDSILIVYPQERHALQAIERFGAYGLSFETIEPPAHMRDVACPAVKVSRSLFGRIQEVSKENGLFHLGVVDWRPPAPDAERLERATIADGPLLLETVQITFIAACMADDTKLRFIAQFDKDISEVMPYLNATVKGAVYTPNIPTLGFQHGYRMVTLYGTRLAVGKTDEIMDTWRTMAWVKDLVNETWSRRDAIEPCMEERAKPQPLEIFKRLPGTNCRDCGEPSCMAFAARLSRGEADLTGCPHMYLPEYEPKRAALLTLFPGLEAEGGRDKERKE
jgi:ArsR family metal-binding transcriptional regulator